MIFKISLKNICSKECGVQHQDIRGKVQSYLEKYAYMLVIWGRKVVKSWGTKARVVRNINGKETILESLNIGLTEYF